MAVDLSLARKFRNAVLNISAKEGQPATLGTEAGTVFYNDGTNDHLNRVWVRMGSDQQVLVVANVGKHGLPSTPGLEVNVAERYGSLYVDDWVAPTGIGGTTTGGGIGGHTHDYETRNVKVSEHAGTPAGSDNVVVGNAAGDALGASSAENVIVGSSAGASAANDAESVVIGYNAGNYAAVAPLINSWDAGTNVSDAPPTDKIFMHRDGTRSNYEHSAKVGPDTYVYQWSDKNNAVRYIRAFKTDGTYGADTLYIGGASTTNDFTICSLDTTAQTFLIGYMYNTGTYLDYFLRVCSVSGVTITIGSEFHVSGYQGNPSVLSWSFHVERLSNTTALVTLIKNISAGVDSYAMVATISGLTVSVGSAIDYTAGDDTAAWQCFSIALSSTRAIIVWHSPWYDDPVFRSRFLAVEASISGSTITLGASDYILAEDNDEEPRYAYGQALSSTKFILTFIRSATDVTKILVGEVDGSDVITKGSEVTVNSDAISYPPIISVVSSTIAVIAYEVASDPGFYARFVTIDGLVPTLDTADQFNETGTPSMPHIYYDDGSLVVIYELDDVVGGSWDYARFTIGNLITNTRTANTFVGAGAGGGDDISYGVAIGHDAGANETASYRLYIDVSNTATPLIYGEFDDRNLGVNTADMASGEGVIAIANASVVPAGTPTGGGVLYVESGALKYKGSSGTVTTIANA